MLPQQVRNSLQALHISINEFSTFVASRGLDDDVFTSTTAEGGPRLQDTLAQLQQLCEIAEELANVLHEMRSPMQTSGSCSTVTVHQPLDMSQTTQECRKSYQDSPVETRSVGLEHDKSFENLPVSSLTRDLLRRGVHPIRFPRDPSLQIGPIYLSDIGEDETPLINMPPKRDPYEERPASCPEPLDQFAHCKILVAGDNWMNQKIMVKFLGKLGIHNNATASNGQATVDAVRESMEIYQPFDFIFMDERMPFFSCREATVLIRKMGFQGPICALLVNVSLTSKEKAFDAGVTTILQKPFRFSAVRDTLEQYLTPLVEKPIVDETPLPRRKPDIKSKL